MPRYPGASWRPLASNWASQPRMPRVDLVLLHTMCGSLAGTDSMFRADGFGGNESHFGVGHDGTIYQWQDTSYKAEANGAANIRAVSIETADYGLGFDKWNLSNGDDVPYWTPLQVSALADLVAWICQTHDIPLTLIPDSRRDRRGVGYHRLGVPVARGNPFSVTGGELWSSATGKSCPGPRRIYQIPRVIEMASGGRRDPIPIPVLEDDDMLQSYEIEPGSGGRRMVLPTGGQAVVVARAWLGFAVNGPNPGKVRCFFQNASGGGISDTGPTKVISFGNGASRVVSFELPASTAQVVIQWEMPEGGTFTYEGLSRKG